MLVPSEGPETFGMVVLEAWREGRPVIAASTGALAEIVEHDSHRAAIPEQGLHGAVSAVRMVERDGALGRRLGQAGLREALTRFSMESHLDHVGVEHEALVGRRVK